MQLAGVLELAFAHRPFVGDAGPVELFLDLGDGGQGAFFRLPLFGQLRGVLLQSLELLLQLLQPVLGRLVALFLEGLALDLQLDDAAVELVDLLGLGIDLHA